MNVYHYCSMDTFFAIARNKTIRLSDITKSNDSMEIMWLTKYIEDTFIEAYDRENAGYFKKNYPLEIFKELAAHYTTDFFDENKRIYSHYVCCFSEAESGDVLSQWRGYADDGKGVSIGIDGELLSQIGVPPKDDPISSQITYFDKVEYSEFAQKQMVKKAVERLIVELKPIAKKHHSDDVNQLKPLSMPAFNRCFLQLFNRAIFAKNPFFKEEKEYRICHWIDTQADDPHVEKIQLGNHVRFDKFTFQNRRGGLVSYFDLNFSECPTCFIKEVVIGPKCPPTVTESDVRRFLANSGLPTEKITIRRSEGTYV